MDVRFCDNGTSTESVVKKGAFVHFSQTVPAGEQQPTQPQMEWNPVDGFAVGPPVRGTSGIVESGSISPTRRNWGTRPVTARQGSAFIEGLDNGESSTDLFAGVSLPAGAGAGAGTRAGSQLNLVQGAMPPTVHELERKVTARRKQDEEEDEPLPPTPPASPSRPGPPASPSRSGV